MNGKMQSEITLDDWRFSLHETGGWIEVENTSRPYGRRNVQCAPLMRHSDLEMFARGWVSCFDNRTYFSE